MPQYRLSERNEIYFGDWAMCHHRELTHEDAESYAAWCTDWQNTIPTNGADFQALDRSMERVISRLDAFSDCQNLLIVSHQGVLSLLITRLLAMPAASLWHFRVERVPECNGYMRRFRHFKGIK